MKATYGAGQFTILEPVGAPEVAGPANVVPLYKVIVVVFESDEGFV